MNKSIQSNGRQTQWQLQLLDAAGLPHTGVDKLAWIIWRNPTNQDSLRLTRQGYKWAIETCKQTGYKFEIESTITNGALLNLERSIEAPYFIQDRKHISFLSERDAIMMELHAHDLNGYLLSLGG